MRDESTRGARRRRPRRAPEQPSTGQRRDGQGARRARGLRYPGKPPRRWVQTVPTGSTYPPEGLFTKDAPTIARILASTAVSPRGITSGLRMLLFFINRAGRGLTRRRRAELERAKRIMQKMVAREHASERRHGTRST